MRNRIKRAGLKSLGTIGPALCLAAILSPNAHAQTSPATVDPERAYTYADNQAIVDLTTTYDGTGTAGRKDVYAGAESTSLLTGGGGQLPSSFDTYCVQLGTSILHGSESVNVGPMNGSFNLGKASVNPTADYGGALAWLYTHYAPTVVGPTQAAADQTAALQLSLWEVEYNWNGTGLNGISTTLGSTDALGNALNFYYEGSPTQVNPTVVFDPTVTQAIRDDANTMLTDWNGQTDDTSAAFLDGSPSNAQGLIGPRVTTGVPEPASLALALGPVLVGLVGIRRRRK